LRRGECRFLRGNVADGGEVQQVAEQTIAKFGRLDRRSRSTRR
jgi:hypothetical protein